MKNFGQTLVWMKSRKWTYRLFFNFLDMTCVNAWILHRRINKDFQMRLIDFKLKVADTLFLYNAKHMPLRGCPNRENHIAENQMHIQDHKRMPGWI